MNDKVYFRMCMGCREMVHKSNLFRISLKEGVLEADLSQKSGGRGAYVCGYDCMQKAEKAKRLNRIVKRALSDSEIANLYKELEEWSKTKN